MTDTKHSAERAEFIENFRERHGIPGFVPDDMVWESGKTQDEFSGWQAAHAAIAAAAPAGDPVVWRVTHHDGSMSYCRNKVSACGGPEPDREVIPLYASPVPAAAPIPDGMVLAPDYRGYAHLGLGMYALNHSAAGEAPELAISIATDSDKAGRVVGEERENEPGTIISPESIAVRICFANVAGLDALEGQLRHLRRIHFPESAAAPKPALTDAQISEIWDKLPGLQTIQGLPQDQWNRALRHEFARRIEAASGPNAALVESLAEMIAYLTEPAGMTEAIAMDTQKMEAFFENLEKSRDAMVAKARAALSAAGVEASK